MLVALEEDPEEFSGVREALYRALAPRDDFEEIIVDDMADIHWCVRRMLRAEAGARGAAAAELFQDAVVRNGWAQHCACRDCVELAYRTGVAGKLTAQAEARSR